MMYVCDEMQKLRDFLDEKDITWRDNSENMKSTIEMWICRTLFEVGGHSFSVVNGFGTYGGWAGANLSEKNLGLLEMMIDECEPFGWLTAEDIIILLNNYNY